MSFLVTSGVPLQANAEAVDVAKELANQSQAAFASQPEEAPVLDAPEQIVIQNVVDSNDSKSDDTSAVIVESNKNDEMTSGAKRKKKTRRVKRRKLDPDELKQKRMKKAPCNTTQFIMNDHCERIIDIEKIEKDMEKRQRGRSWEEKEDDEFYSSLEDESDYLQQQFIEAYDNVHNERLNSMSQNEMVQEYMQLEERVENLKKRLQESRTGRQRSLSESQMQTEQDNDDNQPHKGHFYSQVLKLSQENERLRKENERLQKIVENCHKSCDEKILDQSGTNSVS